jgi:hypothetical protein
VGLAARRRGEGDDLLRAQIALAALADRGEPARRLLASLAE